MPRPRTRLERALGLTRGRRYAVSSARARASHRKRRRTAASSADSHTAIVAVRGFRERVTAMQRFHRRACWLYLGRGHIDGEPEGDIMPDRLRGYALGLYLDDRVDTRPDLVVPALSSARELTRGLRRLREAMRAEGAPRFEGVLWSVPPPTGGGGSDDSDTESTKAMLHELQQLVVPSGLWVEAAAYRELQRTRAAWSWAEGHAGLLTPRARTQVSSESESEGEGTTTPYYPLLPAAAAAAAAPTVFQLEMVARLAILSAEEPLPLEWRLPGTRTDGGLLLSRLLEWYREWHPKCGRGTRVSRFRLLPPPPDVLEGRLAVMAHRGIAPGDLLLLDLWGDRRTITPGNMFVARASPTHPEEKRLEFECVG